MENKAAHDLAPLLDIKKNNIRGKYDEIWKQPATSNMSVSTLSIPIHHCGNLSKQIQDLRQSIYG
jgi:hypothetical protein